MSTTFQIITPVNGVVHTVCPFATESDVLQAAEKARRAQPGWAQVSLQERKSVCSRFLEVFAAQRDQISEELAWLMGRPVTAGPGEIKGVIERTTYLLGVAEETLAEEHFEDRTGFERWISREPLGVVFVIAPWNYPYLTAINSIVPALLAGNAVLLKHATQTAPCAERLAKAFRQVGLPEDLLVSLPMTHEVAAKLIASPLINHVVLTGSVGAGRAVQKAASERFVGVATELGGKDPAFVRADADLAKTVPSLVDGSFFNSGQSCCGVERIYVETDIFEEFVESFVAETRKLVLGNPLDPSTSLGPMVTARAADQVRRQVEEAMRAGANRLIGPDDFPADAPGTAYLAPQVLVGVDHGMGVMRDETFGPAIGIMAVSGDAAAVQLMNDSQYGLSASVWTQDADAARRIDRALETGTVFMNRCDYLDPALPWVGVKDTGRGCSLSKLGFLALSRPKSHHYRLSA